MYRLLTLFSFYYRWVRWLYIYIIQSQMMRSSPIDGAEFTSQECDMSNSRRYIFDSKFRTKNAWTETPGKWKYYKLMNFDYHESKNDKIKAYAKTVLKILVFRLDNVIGMLGLESRPWKFRAHTIMSNKMHPGCCFQFNQVSIRMTSIQCTQRTTKINSP